MSASGEWSVPVASLNHWSSRRSTVTSVLRIGRCGGKCGAVKVELAALSSEAVTSLIEIRNGRRVIVIGNGQRRGRITDGGVGSTRER